MNGTEIPARNKFRAVVQLVSRMDATSFHNMPSKVLDRCCIYSIPTNGIAACESKVLSTYGSLSEGTWMGPPNFETYTHVPAQQGSR